MKFIHFGCWNNGLCSGSNTNGLSVMMATLNQYIETNSIDFLTIAGDNYYPKKEGKEKKFNQIDFDSGFKCLPPDIKKYLLFGNHDIEDIIIDDSIGAIQCKLLDEQIKLAIDNKTIEIFNDVLHKVINDNTLIIMFDSNLYDIDGDLLVTDTCYSRLFNSIVNKSTLKIKDLIKYQNCYIKDILKTYPLITNIIFIGHHPIYSVKSKTKNHIEHQDVYKSNNLIDFMKQIQELLLGKNVYYLCADTHIYQEGIINITPGLQIKQYIVGTGGAEQDNIYRATDTVIEDLHIVYIKSNEKKEFGFLEVEIIETEPEIKFKFISTNPTIIGGSLKKFKIINKNNKFNVLNYL